MQHLVQSQVEEVAWRCWAQTFEIQGPFLLGRPRLQRNEQAKVNEANILMQHFLAMCEGVSLRGGAHALEHPEDPGDVAHDGLCASIFATRGLRELETRTHPKRSHCHQCMFGSPAVKPTCVSGTLDGLEAERVDCDGSHTHANAHGEDDSGYFRSTPLSQYPPAFCKFLAACIVGTLERFASQGSGPTGWMRSEVRSMRVSHWSRKPRFSGDLSVAILNEQAVRGHNTILRRDQQAAYLHVDDGLFFGDVTQSASTDVTMDRCANALEATGFVVKDRSRDGELDRMVGFQPQRSPARLLLPGPKAVLLVDALRSLGRQREVEVDQVRAAVGVWVWARC